MDLFHRRRAFVCDAFKEWIGGETVFVGKGEVEKSEEQGGRSLSAAVGRFSDDSAVSDVPGVPPRLCGRG